MENWGKVGEKVVALSLPRRNEIQIDHTSKLKSWWCLHCFLTFCTPSATPITLQEYPPISPRLSGPSCYREEQNRTNSRLLFYLSYYFILALVFVLYLFNAWVASLPSLSISFLASKSAWDWPSQHNGDRSTPTWKRNSKFNHKPLPLQLSLPSRRKIWALRLEM